MSQGSDPGRVSVSLLQHVAPSLRLRLSSAVGKGQCPDCVLPLVWAVGVPAVLWGFRIRLSLSTEMEAGILKGGTAFTADITLGCCHPPRPTSAGARTWMPSTPLHLYLLSNEVLYLSRRSFARLLLNLLQSIFLPMLLQMELFSEFYFQVVRHRCLQLRLFFMYWSGTLPPFCTRSFVLLLVVCSSTFRMSVITSCVSRSRFAASSPEQVPLCVCLASQLPWNPQPSGGQRAGVGSLVLFPVSRGRDPVSEH